MLKTSVNLISAKLINRLIEYNFEGKINPKPDKLINERQFRNVAPLYAYQIGFFP